MALQLSVGRWADIADRLRIRATALMTAGPVHVPVTDAVALEVVIDVSVGADDGHQLLVRPTTAMLSGWGRTPLQVWSRARTAQGSVAWPVPNVVPNTRFVALTGSGTTSGLLADPDRLFQHVSASVGTERPFIVAVATSDVLLTHTGPADRRTSRRLAGLAALWAEDSPEHLSPTLLMLGDPAWNGTTSRC